MNEFGGKFGGKLAECNKMKPGNLFATEFGTFNVGTLLR